MIGAYPWAAQPNVRKDPEDEDDVTWITPLEDHRMYHPGFARRAPTDRGRLQC